MGIIPVKVASVKKASVDRLISATGTVISAHTVTVRSRVDGVLQRVLFREGQQVNAGQLLAEIDARPFELTALQAEGALQRDQAQCDNAKRDLARYQHLEPQASASQQQTETQAALVKQCEAAIKVSRAQLAAARLQLSYTKITSPIQGYIGLRNMDSGNLIHPSDAAGLAVVTQTAPIHVVFTVPHDRIASLLPLIQKNPRQYAVFAKNAGASQSLEGSVLAVDNQVDASSGTIKFKAQFPNESGVLFPNQFVTVSLRSDALKDVLTVPVVALQQGAKGAFVYVVKEGAVSQRFVSIALTQGEIAVVSQGLMEGDQVVIEGVDRLRDGARVRVLSDTPPSPKG
jgi:multidrug efflux system membrane fusion protein